MIKIAGYPMDLALSEEFTFPGEMTSRPVELGPDVSDHIRDLPEEITLECIVSDTPIGDIARDPTRAGTDFSLRELDPDELRPLPSIDALAKLRELKALRRPVPVETSLGTFTDMAILNIKVSRDANKSNGLFFTVDLAKFNFVVNRRTKVRVKTPMAGAGGKAKAKATAATKLTVNNEIVWFHGVPPGAPFKAGNAVETIRVVYTEPAGLSDEEKIALGRVRTGLSGVDPGSSFIQYFKVPSGLLIAGGAERTALVADLRRDAEAKRRAEAKRLTPPEAVEEAVATIKRASLPPGKDLSRFKRPVPGPFKPAPFNGVP
jgi:hypothetical protein